MTAKRPHLLGQPAQSQAHGDEQVLRVLASYRPGCLHGGAAGHRSYGHDLKEPSEHKGVAWARELAGEGHLHGGGGGGGAQADGQPAGCGASRASQWGRRPGGTAPTPRPPWPRRFAGTLARIRHRCLQMSHGLPTACGDSSRPELPAPPSPPSLACMGDDASSSRVCPTCSPIHGLPHAASPQPCAPHP